MEMDEEGKENPVPVKQPKNANSQKKGEQKDQEMTNHPPEECDIRFERQSKLGEGTYGTVYKA